MCKSIGVAIRTWNLRKSLHLQLSLKRKKKETIYICIHMYIIVAKTIKLIWHHPGAICNSLISLKLRFSLYLKNNNKRRREKWYKWFFLLVIVVIFITIISLFRTNTFARSAIKYCTSGSHRSVYSLLTAQCGLNKLFPTHLSLYGPFVL